GALQELGPRLPLVTRQPAPDDARLHDRLHQALHLLARELPALPAERPAGLGLVHDLGHGRSLLDYRQSAPDQEGLLPARAAAALGRALERGQFPPDADPALRARDRERAAAGLAGPAAAGRDGDPAGLPDRDGALLRLPERLLPGHRADHGG